MSNLVSATRGRPAGQGVHVRYEVAGHLLHDGPVPWHADAVVVELLLRIDAPLHRHKADYQLKLPGRDPVPTESFRKEDGNDNRFRLVFRLPVPLGSTGAELLWRNKLVTTFPIDVLSPTAFLDRLTLTNATLAVRVGTRSVAAQTFVAGQCRGLTAAAVVRSPTPLAPLAELGLRVVFRCESTAAEWDVPVSLTGAQLAQREALVTAAPPKLPRRAGGLTATWVVGDRELFTMRATGVSRQRFHQSLRVADCRFVVADKAGVLRVSRHAPPPGDPSRVGPCFVLVSREPGMAGLVTLTAHLLRAGPEVQPLEQQVLVTDGPTVFAPGTLDPADLAGASGFELRHAGRVLGAVSLNPVPSAAFTSEGGFKPPPDFPWTPTADDELSERLLKLMREQQ